MNRETIIQMAREAGFQTGVRDYADGNGGLPFVTTIATGSCLPELERFATAIRAATKEEDARICEALAAKITLTNGLTLFDPADCAEAIRDSK